MDLELRQNWTNWLVNAVRKGSTMAREELKLVDAEKCALAEEPFKTAMGAKMLGPELPSDFSQFDLIDGFFHPRNRGNMHKLFMRLYQKNGSLPFMTLERNTYLHAGAALGVNIDHFNSYIIDFPSSLDLADVFGNTPLHVALRCNNPKHAKVLLMNGANAAVKNQRDHSPCHWLVYIDDPKEQEELVPLLVKNGAELRQAAKSPNDDPYSFMRYSGTPLHWAVQMNMLELTKALLLLDADPEIVHDGVTPIDIAVERSNAEVLRALLMKASKPPISQRVCTIQNGPNPAGFISTESYVNFAISSLLLHDRWLFHGPVWLDRLRETLHVLQEFELNFETEHSALKAAALSSNGSPEILQLLVKEGHDGPTESKAEFWQELLHESIHTSEPFVIMFLFEQYMRYTSVKELDRPEEMLLKCVTSRNCDISVLEKILETGVDIDCRNDHGQTPLIKAVFCRNYELATFLLDRGADVNYRYDRTGEENVSKNILHDLILSNMDIELGPLKYLLEPMHPHVDKIPDFVVIPEIRATALHLACSTGNTFTIEYILKKFPGKEQINSSTKAGWTALHYSTYHGHLEVVRMLCNAGADVNARTGGSDVPRHQRSTVLDFCFLLSTPPKDHIEHIHGRKMTKEDIYVNRLRISEYLQELSASKANKKLMARPKPLMFAYLAVITQTPRLLDEALRRLDLGPTKKEILDALLFDACKRESTSIVNLLIKAGADVNVRSKKNNTPLHIATTCEQPLIVHLLLENGAEVNPVNDNEDTPLTCALIRRLPASIHALKKAGGCVAARRATLEKTFRDMGMEPPEELLARPIFLKIRLAGEPSEDEDDEDDNEGGEAASGQESDAEGPEGNISGSLELESNVDEGGEELEDEEDEEDWQDDDDEDDGTEDKSAGYLEDDLDEYSSDDPADLLEEDMLPVLFGEMFISTICAGTEED